jgi:hypothetical protein
MLTTPVASIGMVTPVPRDLPALRVAPRGTAARPLARGLARPSVLPREVLVELERIRIDVTFADRLLDADPGHPAALVLAGTRQRLDLLAEKVTGEASATNPRPSPS